jgi:hypothetical protein
LSGALGASRDHCDVAERDRLTVGELVDWVRRETRRPSAGDDGKAKPASQRLNSGLMDRIEVGQRNPGQPRARAPGFVEDRIRRLAGRIGGVDDDPLAMPGYPSG